MVSNSDHEGHGVLVPVPLGERRVFRNQATDDVLEVLYRNPHEEFGVRQLRELTGHGGGTVDTALELLDQLELLEIRWEGNSKRIGIDRERVRKPDDPVMRIPQDTFREPVASFLDEVRQAQGDNLVGVLLFGSVARGTADRASDVDVQVIVDDDLVESRRAIQTVRQRIEDERFDGDRYEFEVLVESVDTAAQHGEKLQSIFTEAITLYAGDGLERLKGAILDG